MTEEEAKAKLELEKMVEKLNDATKNVKFELSYENGKIKLLPIFAKKR